MRSRSRRVFPAAILVAAWLAPVAMAPWAVRPSVISTNQLIITEGSVRAEDVYAAAQRVIVEGTLDGDLVAAAGDVFIPGTVTGDVMVLSAGRVVIGGTVEGSVRLVARSVQIDGTVADDLAVSGLDLGLSGEVGRDVLFFGGNLVVTGTVGRNVQGQFLSGEVDGVVAGNVDVTSGTLTVGASADVAGNLLYRSSQDATISGGASVDGSLVRLPVRFPFVVELALRLAGILSVFALLVSGIGLIWLFRNTAPAAVGAVATRPLRTFLVGLGVLVLGPVTVFVLALTLAGLPLALLVLVALTLAFFFGPVPAVTAVGDRILRGRGGLMGGFVVGALLWRGAMWLVPLVGLFVYGLALTWGVGGWAVAMWERRKAPSPSATAAVTLGEPPLPEVADPGPAGPPGDDDWEAPLPPEAPSSDEAAPAGEAGPSGSGPAGGEPGTPDDPPATT